MIQPTDTNTPFPWTGILFGLTFVMANAYMIGNQTIVQRCLTAKNEWHAKASMIFAGFLKMFIPVLILFLMFAVSGKQKPLKRNPLEYALACSASALS